MTKAERKMWYDLFAYQSYKVCRQQPIDHYIVDFYIASANLVIEIDGDSHYTDDAIEYDIYRTEILAIYGLRVMRFTNAEVLDNLVYV
jgi:very-short-patch-repair endonuclease